MSLLLFTVPDQAIPHWKGQKLNFKKKKIRSQETHNIPHKKNKQCIFLDNYFQKILPEKLYILCNTVQIIFFLQYLSKTAQISVENIERLTIFYKFIL